MSNGSSLFNSSSFHGDARRGVDQQGNLGGRKVPSGILYQVTAGHASGIKLKLAGQHGKCYGSQASTAVSQTFIVVSQEGMM